MISKCLAENLKQIQDSFSDCTDLVLIPWSYGSSFEHNALSVYFETMIQNEHLKYMKSAMEDLITYEAGSAEAVTPKAVMRFFRKHGITGHSPKLLKDIDEVNEQILSGDIVIFFDHWEEAISYAASGLPFRQVSEPITEPVVQGPHISTIEELNVNIGIIRGLLKSAKLKFEYFTVGEISQRKIAYGYLDGAVNPESLLEFKQKIADIDTEEILETSYLEEWISDSVYSPFPQVRYTERPDTVVSALLDGKIIVMVNGTPTILICPGIFFEFLASSEDYYQQTIFASLIRILRFGAFVIALLLPSIYIALSTFHSEMIPTVLLLAILDTREGIPFPAFVEALIMEVFFELLREAGIRLPRPIGSAVSIVGALVIGQAAIQAKIASPVMVIVVALTGIASFTLPQYSMAISIRMLRFPLMILASTLGGLGIMFGLLLIFLHLVCLRSLGQPYFAPLGPLRINQLRDVFIVAPRKILLHQPRNRHLHKRKGGKT